MNNQLSIRYTVGGYSIHAEDTRLNGHKARGSVATIVNKIKNTERILGKTLNEVYITSSYHTPEQRQALFQAIKER